MIIRTTVRGWMAKTEDERVQYGLACGAPRTARAKELSRKANERNTYVDTPSLRAPSPQKCLADRAVPPCIREAYGLLVFRWGTF